MEILDVSTKKANPCPKRKESDEKDFSRPVARCSQRLLAHYTRRAFTAFFVFLWLTGQTFSVPSVHSASTELSRDEALSYFLLNSAYFSKWQGDNDPQVSKVLRIGVLGRDTLGKTLDIVSEKAQSTWFANGRILIERSLVVSHTMLTTCLFKRLFVDCHVAYELLSNINLKRKRR
jgi:hypothetical protein